jgi:uncharacterized membrane protein YadS
MLPPTNMDVGSVSFAGAKTDQAYKDVFTALLRKVCRIINLLLSRSIFEISNTSKTKSLDHPLAMADVSP